MTAHVSSSWVVKNAKIILHTIMQTLISMLINGAPTEIKILLKVINAECTH